MAKPIDIAGQRYGRLVAIKMIPNEPGKSATKWLFLCDCGKEYVARVSHVRDGSTSSCGCLAREVLRDLRTIHGGTDTPEYIAWLAMIQRCEDPKRNRWPRYGGRGIRVCAKWRSSFATFFADLGPKPSPRHSVDRINVDGHYEPGNVRWATSDEQSRNRSDNRVLSVDGEAMPLVDWSKRSGVRATTIARRIRLGWSTRDAIFTPVQESK